MHRQFKTCPTWLSVLGACAEPAVAAAALQAAAAAAVSAALAAAAEPAAGRLGSAARTARAAAAAAALVLPWECPSSGSLAALAPTAGQKKIMIDKKSKVLRGAIMSKLWFFCRVGSNARQD